MRITGNSKIDDIKYHKKKDCKGSFCTLHNPSNHKMRDWPMNLRTDPWAFPLIERICPHGVGHPDPDSVAYLNKKMGFTDKDYGYGVHGCDGCCFDLSINNMRKEKHRFIGIMNRHPYTCGICQWGRDGAYHDKAEYDKHMTEAHNGVPRE